MGTTAIPRVLVTSESRGPGAALLMGVNRNLAILGVSSACIASNPSDMNVALAMLDTIVHTRGHSGERKISISDFYKLPGDTPQIETVLEPNELIVKIEIPKHTWFAKSIYVKVRDRASYAFALTSAAVALDIHQGHIRDARVALGGVGTVPWRSKEAEQVLKNQAVSPSLFAKAAQAAVTDAKPRPGNTFKVDLVQRNLMSALQKLGGVS